MARDPASRVIHPEAARRAICLDFEGAPHAAPVFSGWLMDVGGSDHALIEYHSTIHDPALMELCTDIGMFDDQFAASSDSSRTIAEAIADIVATAEGEDRLIISWSTHDRKMVREYVRDRLLVGRFEARYRNAKKTATRWARASGQDVRLPSRENGVRNTLTAYARLLGITLPADYGLKNTMKRYRAVERYFIDTQDLDLMDEDARNAWNGFVRHNAFDCLALHRITVRVATELARLSARPH